MRQDSAGRQRRKFICVFALLVLAACSDPALTPSSDAGGTGGSAGAVTAGGASGSGEVPAPGSAGAPGGSPTAGSGAGGQGSSCADQGAATTYPSELSWSADANTLALYRFSDASDASPNGLNLTNEGNVPFEPGSVTGDPSAYVARFGGGAQSLSRGELTLGSELTLEARVKWQGFKRRACGSVVRILALSKGTSGVSLEQPCDSSAGARVRVDQDTEIVTQAEFEDVLDNAWHTVRIVIAAGAASFSVDGTKLGSSAAVSSLGESGWTLTVGEGFSGEMDELRLSTVVRSDGAPAPTVAARPAYSELAANASLPLTAQLSEGAQVVWSKLSGPGDVRFSAPNSASTQASFCAPGKYVLQATAHDASYAVSDVLVVRVWPEGGRAEPYKALFLGNSFSFFNGTVGYRLWEFARQGGEAMGDSYAQSPYVKMMTSPGQNFQFHWYEANTNGECTDCEDHVLPAPPLVNLTDFLGANAQDVIRDGQWDIVFLHTQSSAPATDSVGFFRYGKKLDRLIKASGGRVVFYQTWAYPGSSNTMPVEETILTNYEKLASETGAALSPVGRSFQTAREAHDLYASHPSGILYSDNHHPNSFGTYLAGAVHYAVAYGKSPAGLGLYPGVGDIPTPEISSDTARADLLLAIAATHVPATPLAHGAQP